jgi:mercuric ion transport protein
MGAVLAGIAASSCCLAPLLIASGAGGLAFFARWEPYWPLFVAAAVGLLAYAFYQMYRSRAKCESCGITARRRAQEIALWVAAFLTVSLILFPYVAFLFR